VVLQDVSGRTLSAGFAREENDARSAEYRNKESTTTFSSSRTMRYAVVTAFRASSSVDSDLLRV
jgi:hypothetical protein